MWKNLFKPKVCFVLLLVSFGLLFAYLNRHAVAGEMAGVYVSNENGFQPVEVELHPDGTYSNYMQRQNRKNGHWHLEHEVVWENSLVLDSDSSSPGSYSDEYLLTRKSGGVCIEADGDDGDVYWCKKQ